MVKGAKGRVDPYVVALLLIIAVNMLLKWRFFCGLVQADDFSYGVYSYTLFRLPWPWGEDMDFRMLRFGLMAPLSLLFTIFPPTEVTAVMYSFIASTASVVLTWLIGKRLYGANAGLLGAFVLSTFPADVVFGTMILPDILVPFYLLMAVWLFLRALDRGGRSAMIYYLFSGMFVFAAFQTRENSYYFALFFLPFALNRERWKQGLWLAGVGFVVPLMLIYLVYFLKTGDFLYNVHLATSARDSQVASGYIPPNSANWFVQLKYMLPVLIGRGSMLSPMYGIIFYIGIPCVIYTAVKAWRSGERMALLMPLWFVLVYLMLDFGSLSFTSYQMMKKLPRFLLTLTPAMAMAWGVVLADAFGVGTRVIRSISEVKLRWVTAVPAIVVMLLVLYTSGITMAYQKSSRDANMAKFRWGYGNVLAKRSQLPVYGTGGWWFNKLSFYYMPDLRYADMRGKRSDMLRDLMAERDPWRLAGSHVIIDRSHFTGQNDLRIRHSYDDAEPWVLAPPEEWELIGQGYNTEIYAVSEKWTYRPVPDSLTVRRAMRGALGSNDPMRFLYTLNPEYVKTLDKNTFFARMNELRQMTDEQFESFIDNHAVFSEYQGKVKITLQ